MDKKSTDELIISIRDHGEMIGYANIAIAIDLAEKDPDKNLTIQEIYVFCLSKLRDYLMDDKVDEDEKMPILTFLRDNGVI